MTKQILVTQEILDVLDGMELSLDERYNVSSHLEDGTVTYEGRTSIEVFGVYYSVDYAFTYNENTQTDGDGEWVYPKLGSLLTEA